MPEHHCTVTGVYCWRNLVNGKVYVGSAAKSFTFRRNKHLQDLRKSKHSNRFFAAAWAKYGAENFVFEVLEVCLPDECIQCEQWWIDTLKSANREYGYNLSPTAASTRGVTLSEETRRKMSKSRMGQQHMLGHKLSESHKAAILRSNKGRKMPDHVRAAIRENNYTDAMRAKVSVASKAMWARFKSLPLSERLKMGGTGRLKGCVFSKEHKLALSIAAKQRWARWREERNRVAQAQGQVSNDSIQSSHVP